MKSSYVRSPLVPFVVNTDMKPYRLTIRDLPHDQKPREKLLRNGPGALSMSELWAVVLSVGTKKEDVLGMSSRILKEYGERSIVNEQSPVKLAATLDIPIGKAQQVVSALEIGRRLFQRNPSGASIIRTAADVYEYTRSMWDLPKEHLRGIYLNSHYKVIHDEVVSIGTIDANIVHPREVFRPAIEYAAAAVILVHNHPSGDLTPSEGDVIATGELLDAGKLLGIELIDHVIVSKNGFKSIFSLEDNA